jgi:hypothetical protein
LLFSPAKALVYLLGLRHEAAESEKIRKRQIARKKNVFGVVFLKCWLSLYTLAICVISEKAAERLVIGNRRKTVTVTTCPYVYVCGDAVFGDASER